MIKNKFAIFFDSLIICLLTSFVIFIWSSKYIKNAIFCYFVCILIFLLMFVVIFNYSLKKYNIKKLSIKDIKFASVCFNSLINFSHHELINFYEKLFDAKQISNNIFSNNNIYFYIDLQKHLTDSDFLNANQFYLETDKSLPLIFVSIGFTEEFNKLLSLSSFNYQTYESADVFNLMKNTNLYPASETQSQPKNIKNTFLKAKTKFIGALTKNKFKNFFLSGLSLILISIFIPYSIYYQIFGTFFLILSIVCLFDKSTNNNQNQKTSLTSLIKKDADK